MNFPEDLGKLSTDDLLDSFLQTAFAVLEERKERLTGRHKRYEEEHKLKELRSQIFSRIEGDQG